MVLVYLRSFVDLNLGHFWGHFPDPQPAPGSTHLKKVTKKNNEPFLFGGSNKNPIYRVLCRVSF